MSLSKIVFRHVQKATAEDHPNLLFIQDDADAAVTYVAVVGLPHPYRAGEFFFKLTAPDNFPRKPPELRCLTENGVFMVGGKICISVGEFHATDQKAPTTAAGQQGDWGWRAGMGLRGFAVEVLNGLIDPDRLNEVKHPDSGQGGLGILDTPAPRRAEIAAVSLTYNNVNNPGLRARFIAHVKQHPTLRASKAWLRQAATATVSSAVCAGAPLPAPLLSVAFGDEIAARLRAEPAERQSVLVASLCGFDWDYQLGIMDCLTAADADVARVAGARFAFLAEVVTSPALVGAELKCAVVDAARANMNLEFDRRDAVLRRLAGGT